MVILKTAAGAAIVLVSLCAGATSSASHSQVHSRYSQTPHPAAVKVHSPNGLPRSTVAPAPASAAGPARTHVSEVDRLEHQSSLQLRAEAKHEARPAGGPSHVAHSEMSGHSSGHGSDINFSYRSQAVHTNRSTGSGSRRP